MSVVQVIVLHPHTKFEVRRPFWSEDMADFRSLLEHSDSGKNNSIRFDSIRQFDETDACTLIVSHT